MCVGDGSLHLSREENAGAKGVQQEPAVGSADLADLPELQAASNLLPLL